MSSSENASSKMRGPQEQKLIFWYFIKIGFEDFFFKKVSKNKKQKLLLDK